MECKKPLITIVVPVYNVETVVSKCLESLIKQTYQNIDIIIVNDGSTDNSLKICNDFTGKDSRIKIYSKDNGGLSSARNYGISKSNGEYITFVDSDDYVGDTYIETLYSLLVDNNSDISMVGIAQVNQNGNIIDQHTPLKKDRFESNNVFKKALYKNGFHYTMAQAKLFKKELINKNSFRVGAIHEDDFLSNKIYQNDYIVATTDEQLYYYVKNESGIMSNLNKTQKLYAVDFLLERLDINNKLKLNIGKELKKSIYGRLLHSIKFRGINGLEKQEIKSRITSFLIKKPYSIIYCLKYIKLKTALLLYKPKKKY